MSETMSDDNSDPGDKYLSAYTNWASGNWGGILTGTIIPLFGDQEAKLMIS